MFYLVLRYDSAAAVVEDLSSRHKTHKMSSLPSVALVPWDPTTSSGLYGHLHLHNTPTHVCAHVWTCVIDTPTILNYKFSLDS